MIPLIQVVILFVDPSYLKNSNVRVAMAFLHLLGYSNACVNPALYCFMNESFQRQFVRMATGMCRTSRGESKSKRSAGTSGLSDEKSSLRTPASRSIRDGATYTPGDHRLVDIEANKQANGGTTLSLIVNNSSSA